MITDARKFDIKSCPTGLYVPQNSYVAYIKYCPTGLHVPQNSYVALHNECI